MNTALLALASLSGCDLLGLDRLGPDAPLDSASGGDTAALPQAAEGDPVTVSLEGRVYVVALDALTYAQPQALSLLTSEVEGKELLFYVSEESDTTLDLVAALAGDDGLQNPCDRVQALPSADWQDNPRFTLDRGALVIEAGGGPVTLRDTRLTALVTEDGGAWTGGVLEATVDARELVGTLPEGFDLCAVLEDVDEPCQPCETDGEPSCVDVRIEDLEAEVRDVAFDPEEDGSAC